MPRRKRLKRAEITLAATAQVHDRTTSDVPMNAQIAVDTVDDPYEKGAKITVVKSLRDDPLEWMKSRGSIKEWQYAAGRHWQYLYEQSQVGSVSAIDPTKECVDGGGIYQPFTDRQKEAFEELNKAHAKLPGFIWILYAVLGNRETFQDLGKRMFWTKSEVDNWSWLFRQLLHKLAIWWGYAMDDTRSGHAGTNQVH